MQSFGKQQGAVLIVTLIMLLAVSLLAVSAVNTSTISLRITDNVRTVQEYEAAARQGIEMYVSDPRNFHEERSFEDTIDGLTVRIDPPVCVFSRISTGSGADREGTQDVSAPEETYWEFRARVMDGDDRASPFINQGVRIRMLAGRCEPTS